MRMKAMACQLCSSNSFTKLEDGNFQCDYCRTKYTPAQAKTLLIEGTVRLDRSDDLERFRSISETALRAGNFLEAREYANRLLEIDHKHAHAWFLKGAATGWSAIPVKTALSLEQWSTILDSSASSLREMEWAFSSAVMSSGPSQDYYKSQCAQTSREVIDSLFKSSIEHRTHPH